MIERPRRILYLLLYGSRVGGGEIQYEYLVKGLNRHNFQPIVVCPKEGDLSQALIEFGIEVHFLRLPRWLQVQSLPFRWSAAKRLIRLAKKKQVDLVHSEHRHFPYLKAVGQALSIPTVFHVRSQLQNKHLANLNLHDATAAIIIGDRYRQPLVENGIEDYRLHLISDATDVERFSPNPIDVLNLDTKPNPLAKKEFKIGLVGRIEPKKRQLDFLKSIKTVLGAGVTLSCYLIGSIRVSSYFRKLQRYIKENKLQHFVNFTGKRNDMPEVLSSLDVLVTLSGGSVMIEALSCGTPVISASEVDPARLTIVKDGKNGLIVPSNDHSALVSAILKLTEDPFYIQTLGKNARRHAKKYFSQTAMVQKTEQVYKKLLA
ncbi:hypothetical protein CMK13_15045 [Candidatus Poribacteria bacterium]|nr:hypothetical protein [Candidatus Poribacteria bacterium]OUT57499.1 MAG: hypothetical protein CBB75_14410 [bacterium TMED15]